VISQVSSVLPPHGVLVKQVLGHLVCVGVHSAQISDEVSELLDGLDLLVQVVSLQEVTHLRRRRERRR